MSDAINAVRRMFEGFATGKVDDAAEYIHPDYLNPDSLERSDKRGPESFAQNVAWLQAVFSDLHFEENKYAEVGDIVFARVIMSGRHSGPLLGMPATGRAFYAEQLHLCRIIDGKIEHHRDWRDDLGVLRQLGLPQADV